MGATVPIMDYVAYLESGNKEAKPVWWSLGVLPPVYACFRFGPRHIYMQTIPLVASVVLMTMTIHLSLEYLWASPKYVMQPRFALPSAAFDPLQSTLSPWNDIKAIRTKPKNGGVGENERKADVSEDGSTK